MKWAGIVEYPSGIAVTIMILMVLFAIHGVGRGILVFVGLFVLTVGGTLLFAWLIGKTALLDGHPSWLWFFSCIAALIFFGQIGRLETCLRNAGVFDRLRGWFRDLWS